MPPKKRKQPSRATKEPILIDTNNRIKTLRNRSRNTKISSNFSPLVGSKNRRIISAKEANNKRVDGTQTCALPVPSILRPCYVNLGPRVEALPQIPVFEKPACPRAIFETGTKKGPTRSKTKNEKKRQERRCLHQRRAREGKQPKLIIHGDKIRRSLASFRANRKRKVKTIARARAMLSRREKINRSKHLAMQQLRLRRSLSEAALEARRLADATARRELRRRPWVNKHNAAFTYDPYIDYSSDPSVVIGSMDNNCDFCKALRWSGESAGFCCLNGKISLPMIDDPPRELRALLTEDTNKARLFRGAPRAYNSCFQMTSFGSTREIQHNGLPTFSVQGQVYHRIGSLLPTDNQQPRYLQVYFMGDNRRQAALRCNNIKQADYEIVLEIELLMERVNPYVREFRTAMERLTADTKIVIHADKTPAGQHPGRYNAPTSQDDVALIMVDSPHGKRDIVLELRDRGMTRIDETHRSYDALQYPLMFWAGQDGYHFGWKKWDPREGRYTEGKVSCMAFYNYHLMVRRDAFNHLLRFADLLNQFAVDVMGKMEGERFRFLYSQQSRLRMENFYVLRDALLGNIPAQDVGQRVFLPSTFTGGPRYMQEKTQDAMAYVRKFRRPDLFITITCNSRWPEVTRELFPGQKPNQRHDLLARVFHLKLSLAKDLIAKGQIFGETLARMHTVEWQKRGLPHAHMLIWLKEKLHLDTVDSFISAELPDPVEDPELYAFVSTSQIHGPCGILNPASPCMKDGLCTKGYPRKFLSQTKGSESGYPLYRRRSPEEGGFTASVFVGGERFDVDNRWVIPYCPFMTKLFKCHINVEYCYSVKAIKYVCKYINKGSDMATVSFEDDEIQQYLTARYISTNEAFWRVYGFHIHDHYPPVTQLAVHLPDDQRVFYRPDDDPNALIMPKDTSLTGFFRLCSEDDFAATLLYPDVAEYFIFERRRWQRRKKGKPVEGFPGVKRAEIVSRVYVVHPSQSECFHLRLLLLHVVGPKSYEDLRTFEGVIHPTFKETCLARGLLEDDRQWTITLEEASQSALPKAIRSLFAVIVFVCQAANPKGLWDAFKEHLCEDFLRRKRVLLGDLEAGYDDRVYNEGLVAIENMILRLGGKKLIDYGLPEARREELFGRDPTEILEQRNFRPEELCLFLNENEPRLNVDQRDALLAVMRSVDEGRGDLMFLDAPGGTGKTYLLNVLLAKVRARGDIAVATASSGIAATLLSGGRTAHSAFKIPFKVDSQEVPICSIKRGSGTARVLREAKLIVWDECTMAHKKALEALDRSLRDIRQDYRVMGGVVVLLAGDFRQILPVVPRGTRADETDACLKSSVLWGPAVIRLALTVNMRAAASTASNAEAFASTLLNLGNGVFPSDKDGNVDLSAIGNVLASAEDLAEEVYPFVEERFLDSGWLKERAILAPKNDEVDRINLDLVMKLPGDPKEYLSKDSIKDDQDATDHPPEFLNSLEICGIPSHRLVLKVGAPILLLRNLDPPFLRNGTRLIVKRMMNAVIEATVLTGSGEGEDVFIPRIPFETDDLPFKMKRVQFPVKLSFAMSINKSQGQTFKVVGLNLTSPCFSHGQIYVGSSRVGNPSDLHIFAPKGRSKNIVYQEVLDL